MPLRVWRAFDGFDVATLLWKGWALKFGKPYPACDRFKFGTGFSAEVRPAADIPAGIAGRQCNLAAFFVDADIPTLFCNGALGRVIGLPPELSTPGEIGRSSALSGKCGKLLRLGRGLLRCGGRYAVWL